MKTVTYLVIEGSNPLAFEGPEEPVKSFEAAHYVSAEHEYVHAYLEWQEAMSTARESALPLVNAEIIDEVLVDFGKQLDLNRPWKISREQFEKKVTIEYPMPLPGWGLEKEPLWDDYRKRPSAQDAYRLVRSEPEKPDRLDSVQWQDIMTTAAGVEPSESQEETQESMLHEILENYEDWKLYNEDNANNFDLFVQSELQKFKIIRK